MPDALNPAGMQAAPVGSLSWVMIVGAFLLLLLVLLVLLLAIFGSPRWKARLGRERMIIALGIVMPVVVLTGLLVWGLRLTSTLVWPEADNPLRIRVTGKQWWWQVAYLDSPVMVTANEIVIPTGRMVQVELQSADVIHSFWVPRLSGKLDMIPGHTTGLTINAEKPGNYRGQCAEYCGGPHALMMFRVIALRPELYAAWRRRQAAEAQAPRSSEAAHGQRIFFGSACVVCHAIRGTDAAGTVGPDLTHVGSRTTLGAGLMPNNRGTLAAWIIDSQHIKPGNRMPSFRMNSEELNALAAYLSELK